MPILQVPDNTWPTAVLGNTWISMPLVPCLMDRWLATHNRTLPRATSAIRVSALVTVGWVSTLWAYSPRILERHTITAPIQIRSYHNLRGLLFLWRTILTNWKRSPLSVQLTRRVTWGLTDNKLGTSLRRPICWPSTTRLFRCPESTRRGDQGCRPSSKASQS